MEEMTIKLLKKRCYLLAIGACLWLHALPSQAQAGENVEAFLPQTKVGKKPEVRFDDQSQTYSLELSVLSYNVAALPWPFLKKRAGPIKAIGEELGKLRSRGVGPDIVLIQEGFRRSTNLLVNASGYPNWVQGPGRSDESDETQSHVPKAFKKQRSLFKGELTGRIMNSGLFVLSEWPIISKINEPFYRGECAGFDCGANKGILWVNISIPGMPGHLQMLTTHLNARGSSGASAERTLKAHNLQFSHVTKFLDQNWDAQQPFIFGGDLNIKNAPDRVAFMEAQSFETNNSDTGDGREATLATTDCLVNPDCTFNIPLDDEKLGIEKQDWQGFGSGRRVRIETVAVDRLFHQSNDQGYTFRGRDTLSDHDGLLVRYRLSWKKLTEGS